MCVNCLHFGIFYMYKNYYCEIMRPQAQRLWRRSATCVMVNPAGTDTSSCVCVCVCVCVSYECGDYVLNDNASDDIQALRSCLKSIATQGQLSTSSVKSRNRQLLRSCSVAALGQG